MKCIWYFLIMSLSKWESLDARPSGSSMEEKMCKLECAYEKDRQTQTHAVNQQICASWQTINDKGSSEGGPSSIIRSNAGVVARVLSIQFTDHEETNTVSNFHGGYMVTVGVYPWDRNGEITISYNALQLCNNTSIQWQVAKRKWWNGRWYWKKYKLASTHGVTDDDNGHVINVYRVPSIILK